VDIGEVKTCTITNDDVAPTLTVIKEIINDDGGSLTIDNVILRIDGNQVTNGTANTLDAGPHAVSEDAISGYAATISGDCDSIGNVSLNIGDEKTCIITNDDNAKCPTKLSLIINPTEVRRGSYFIAGLLIDCEGKPLSGETVTFTSFGPKSLAIPDAKTNSKGTYMLKQRAPYSLGVYSIQAHFAGDDYLLPSDSDVKTMTRR
jgi:hypothetical protein